MAAALQHPPLAQSPLPFACLAAHKRKIGSRLSADGSKTFVAAILHAGCAGLMAGVLSTLSDSCLQARLRTHKARNSRASLCANSRSSCDTELLVDADVHSMDHIEAVIHQLRSGSHQVRTRIVAEPGRMLNKQWRDFVKRHGLMFQPVHRSGIHGDPNDAAIKKQLRSLLSKPAIRCVALLTSDSDFIRDMEQLVLAGKDAMVFPLSTYLGTKQDYEMAGVNVIPVKADKETVYKVGASQN